MVTTLKRHDKMIAEKQTEEHIMYTLGHIAKWDEEIYKNVFKENTYVAAIQIGNDPKNIGILIDYLHNLTFNPFEYVQHGKKLDNFFNLSGIQWIRC